MIFTILGTPFGCRKYGPLQGREELDLAPDQGGRGFVLFR